jgi:biotin-dependent carboxylase-like uncharacterized protein
MITVLNRAPLSRIEDLGEHRYAHLGVPCGGVMDEYAYGIALQLVGDSEKYAVIEVSLAPLHLRFELDSVIAVTGAPCRLEINTQSVPLWQSHTIRRGDEVKITDMTNGGRSYIAVKGGITKKEGLENQRLLQGDRLKINEAAINYRSRLKSQWIPEYATELTLRVMLSYQYDHFSEQEIEKFFTSTYTVTPEISRMGYKLQGEAVHADIDGIVSEGIAYGAVQIPKNGQPIILLKDRQTIGGYLKIGVVLDVDCFKLSQTAPGCKINFNPLSIAEGIEISKRFKAVVL